MELGPSGCELLRHEVAWNTDCSPAATVSRPPRSTHMVRHAGPVDLVTLRSEGGAALGQLAERKSRTDREVLRTLQVTTSESCVLQLRRQILVMTALELCASVGRRSMTREPMCPCSPPTRRWLGVCPILLSEHSMGLDPGLFAIGLTPGR